MALQPHESTAQQYTQALQRHYRTLAVVKQEAITRVEKPLEDSVFVWPRLLVREFFAATLLTVIITLLLLAIDAPLQGPADPNSTPILAKAPWYFLGLQELLHYFQANSAGVMVPENRHLSFLICRFGQGTKQVEPGIPGGGDLFPEVVSLWQRADQGGQHTAKRGDLVGSMMW